MVRTNLPNPGSKWQHTNGNLYKVLHIANKYTTRSEEYPVTIVYKGANGRIWSRPFSRWHKSMTEVNKCLKN